MSSARHCTGFAFGLACALLGFSALGDPPAPPLPTDAEITREARRILHDPHIDASHCHAERDAQTILVRCTQTECSGSCQVVHVSSTIRVTSAGWHLVSQQRVRRGDTGECGDCLSNPL